MTENKTKSPEIELGDFSTPAHSIQTKFITVSLISLFISIFDLADDSAFFGVKVADANERIIEFGFFGVAVLLGGLYFSRIWEERDAFLKIDKNIRNIIDNINKMYEDMKPSQKEFVAEVNRDKLLDGGFVKLIRNEKTDIDSIIKSLETDLGDPSFQRNHKELRQNAVNQLKSIGIRVSDRVDILANNTDALIARLSSLSDQWEDQVTKLREIPNTLQATKKMVVKRRLRMAVFDIVVPIVMLVLVFLCFFCPDEVRALLGHFFKDETKCISYNFL